MKIADREGQWILQLQIIAGAHNIRIFTVATLITDVLLGQFFIHTAV